MALVIYKRRMLIIKLNSPKVKTMAGKLRITRIGLSRELIMPNIKLAIRSMVKLSAPMPLRNADASKRPIKLANHVNKNLLITPTILSHLQI